MMMKKLIIFFLLLVLVGVGALAFAVSRAGSIVAKYKPELEQMASESLGSTVTLGELSVSIFPTAQVRIDSATVSDPERPEAKISIERVSLDLDLIPLLTGTISISTLEVLGPKIVVLREEDGIFVEGLARTTDSEAADTADIPITVDLQSFRLRNASLTWKNEVGGEEYTVENLNMDASFSFAENNAVFSRVDGDGLFMKTVEFEYSGDALRYGMDDGMIGMEGLTASSLGSSLSVAGELSQSDPERKITITSNGVVLDSMGPLFEIFAPAAIEFGVKGTIKPDVEFAFTSTGYLASGSVGLEGFSAGIEDLVGIEDIGGTFAVEATEAKQSLTSQNLTGSMNGAPIKIAMTAVLNPKTGKLEPFDLSAFSGETQMTTRLNLENDTYPFSSTVTSNGMLIEELVPAFAPDMPIAITGTVKSASGNLKGTMDENMMASLTGTSRFLIGDGLIKDVNLGQQVLGSVTDLPFLSGALLDIVPAGMQDFLAKDHTVLSEVSGSFELKNEIMHTQDLKVVSDFFSLEAKGTIGLDTNLDLDSVIHFNKEFSATMVGEMKELSAMLDGNGQMSFPVKIKGIPPELDILPDLSGILTDIVKNTVMNEIESQVGDQLLDGILGGDSETSDADDKDSSLEDSLLGGVKSLFGGKKKK